MRLKQSRATDRDYGLAKISNERSVTETNSGIALSAVQNNASTEGSLRNEIEKLNKKIERKLIYEKSGAIQENEILNLSSNDYDVLEVHHWFEPGLTRACFFLKGNNIVLDYVGVSQNAAMAFTASRAYIMQSDTSYKANIATLLRHGGTATEKSTAWLNISKIYGIKYN